MKEYKDFVIKVEAELANEMIAGDRSNFFTPSQTEDKTTYYLPLINKEDWLVHDGKVIYGNGLIILDPSRTVKNVGSVMQSGDLTMDFITGIIYKKDKEIHLSMILQMLLEMLVRNHERILQREQLIETISSITKNDINDNTLSVYIGRLRNILGKYHGKGYIKTYNGVGYSWNHKVY